MQYLTIESPGRSIPAQTLSSHEWEGLFSNKFPFNQRKHLSPSVTADGFSPSSPLASGRRHFSPPCSPVAVERLCLRTFPNLQNKESVRDLPAIRLKHEFIPSPKALKHEFIPSPKAYGHKQKRHLYQDRSPEMKFRSTIKTFWCSNKGSHTETNVALLMGRKKTLDSVEEYRNMIGVRALGDKIYKSVEYSPGFFLDRGLIVGSTNAFKSSKYTLGESGDLTSQFAQTTMGSFRGVSRREKEKREERARDEQSVKDLDGWERKTFYDLGTKGSGSVEPRQFSRQGSRGNSMRPLKRPILKKRV